MARKMVPFKTPLAVAELSSRQRKLSQRQRTVLLLVDGRRSEDEVRQMARAAGVADSGYDELLQMGMIAHGAAADAGVGEPDAATGAQHIDLPLHLSDSSLSVLPASLSLHSESHLDSASQDLGGAEPGRYALDRLEIQDEALEEARAILMRAVRTEAPVAGSLTLMRLRRARTREDLESLLGEVESRIFKPFKGLWASQTMAHVRELLASHPPLSLSR